MQSNVAVVIYRDVAAFLVRNHDLVDAFASCTNRSGNVALGEAYWDGNIAVWRYFAVLVCKG